MRRFALLSIFVLIISACGGGGGSGGGQQEATTPAATTLPSVTFALSDASKVNESDNPLVTATLSLDRAANREVSARLVIAGTATRDYDYVVNGTGGDRFTIVAGQTSASVEIDIYRDFEVEGDETITLELGELSGDVELTGARTLTLDIVDGEAASTLKSLNDFEIEGEELSLIPLYFQPTKTSMEIGVLAVNRTDGSRPFRVEISSDFDFEEGLKTLFNVDIEPETDDDILNPFKNLQAITIPLQDLRVDTAYYIRAYFDDPPAFLEDEDERLDVAYLGFATNAEGQLRTQCEAPSRVPDPSGEDPLFSEQWHLVNTGQAAFSDTGGISGADLDMRQAIDDGASGAGVKLAIIDVGLEICHPDLAANILPGESHNFLFGHDVPGATPEDPFNYEVLGDHGTSVAGVAAAVANNGLGGRGVAPGVGLVGFNLGISLGEDMERETLLALGGSESMPDSASVDIFNLSWGASEASENPAQDMVDLLKLGTGKRRKGLGALYVKAAGNDFEGCLRTHPLNSEIGCLGSNTDPDQNLPYMINVGGFNASDVKSSYSSAGANLWMVAPSGEDGIGGPAIITTDQAGSAVGYSLDPRNRLEGGNGDYVSAFGGTSSAAPAAAGAIALLLEAAPALTWRDVKHVLAVSARKIDAEHGASRAAFNGQPYIAQPPWITNGAGYDFHNWYGFGALSIDAAIKLLSTHSPDSLGTFTESDWFEYAAEMGEDMSIPDADGTGITQTIDITGLPASANIEAVVLEISVDHFYPIEVGIGLTSPSGTPSILNAPFNSIYEEVTNISSWQLLSNAFYGESPIGEWTLNVVDLAEEDTGEIKKWRVKFYYGEHGEGAASPSP